MIYLNYERVRLMARLSTPRNAAAVYIISNKDLFYASTGREEQKAQGYNYIVRQKEITAKF